MKRIHLLCVLLLVVALIAANVGISFATQENGPKNTYNMELKNNRYYYRVVESYVTSYNKYVSPAEAKSLQSYENAIKGIANLVGISLDWFGSFCGFFTNYWTTPMSREGSYSISKYKLERRKYDRLKNTYSVVNTGTKLYVSHNGETRIYQYWLK